MTLLMATGLDTCLSRLRAIRVRRRLPRVAGSALEIKRKPSRRSMFHVEHQLRVNTQSALRR